ncbi:hypothetical protein AWC20_20195 [Mycobacterium parmense]|nr:hypothetical protein AWC20_20195 [Mycobacterium parmense]
MDSGDTFNTSGTIPETIPGSVLESRRTRLLTGKSNTTSEPSAHHPRTSSAQAAVTKLDCGTFQARDSSWACRSTAGSSRTVADGR